MKDMLTKQLNIYCLRANGPVYLFIILLSFLFLACPEDSPPPRDTTINLGVLSVFATTARLHISVEDTTAEWTFGLTRNGEEVLTATVYNRDTTLIDGGLTSGTQYTYQAHWLEDGAAVDSSVKVTARTTDTKIHLEVLSTFTTTARLHISVEDTTAEWTLGLIRNGEEVLTATVYGRDTTFIDEGLTPSTQYTYQAQRLEDGIVVDMSLTAIAQTMAITSHNFVWEIDTLGIYGSYLNDVAIIDENNIWVVGNIETDTATYNAAHWDGNEWEYHDFENSGKIDGIYSFSENDIWFASGCRIYHWDGYEYEYLYECDWENGEINTVSHIWGASSSNIYFVGNNGSIVHYDGSTFTKLESGTETRLIDIWGLDENHIWVTGREFDFPPSESVLLYYNGIEWSKRAYPDDDDGGTGGIQRRYKFVWAYGDTLYVTTTEGIWKRSISTNDSTLLDRQTLGTGNWSIGRIRGSNYTDVFFHRAGGFVYHYNGLTWEAVFDGQYHFPGNTFMSIGEIALKDNAVYFVGQVFRRAYIARSFR